MLLRTLALEQIGQLAVGDSPYCERMASGHVLVAGHELDHTILLDPTLGRVERLPRGIDAVHVGAGYWAEALDGDLRLVERGGDELANVEVRGDPADLRFGATGTILWELAERRRWEVRARGAVPGPDLGRVRSEAELPEPHPQLRSWSLEAVHPVVEGLVASSVDRHVAVELHDDHLAVHTLAIDSFVDWMPGGHALLAVSFDGWLTVHRWPDGAVVRRVDTARLGDLLDDELGFHGRVIDEDRAILDTSRGRLVIVDLADSSAEVIDLRLTGDVREEDIFWLELGRTGRILTGRHGDRLLKIWDGADAVRTIPARRAGLR